MKRIIYLISISFLLFQISCKKERLDPKPLSFFAPENIFINEEGFRSILNTFRVDIKNEFYGSRLHYMSQEFGGSDLACFGIAPDLSMLTPTSTAGPGPILTMFSDMYIFIKNTNVLISRLDNIEWDDQQVRNSLLAEALFFRSYWYYRLIHSYGDVPWIGEEILGAKLDFYTYSRWAILGKIQSDMEFAVQWLPENGFVGIPTKYAGYHLLTKIYLANTEFDKAIASATTIINGPFALMTERFGSWKSDKNRNVLWDLHRVENKSLPENTEAIFNTIDRFDAPPNAKSLGTFSMTCYVPHWFTVPDKSGAPGVSNIDAQADTAGHGNFVVNTNYFHNYVIWNEFGYNYETTPDLRRCDINWIEPYELVYTRGPNIGEPLSSNWLPNLRDANWQLAAYPHYKTFNDKKNGLPNGTPGGGNGDWYVYRLAETYLLRAEAYFWKNQLAMAAADINMVRQRAQAIPIAAGDVTIDYIFDERARELYTEEPRHSEMVRVANIMAKLNIDGYRLDNFSEKNWYYDRQMRFNNWYNTEPRYSRRSGPESKISPYNVYWPIPQKVITANTKGHINQNPGYIGSGNNIPPIETID